MMKFYGYNIKDASDARAVPTHLLQGLQTYVENVKVHLDCALKEVHIAYSALSACCALALVPHCL